MLGFGEISKISWGDCVLRAGEQLSIQSLDGKATGFLKEAPLGSPWILACSGGADSVLLLLLALCHYPERRQSFVLVHFNHALREEESEADEDFVRFLGNEFDLEFVVGHGKSVADDESSLRNERLAFLQQVAEERSATVVLQGHQEDDVVETLLWRLARGAGLPGLSAPRPVRLAGEFAFVRPLLTVSRKKVRRILTEVGACWSEDESNSSLRYLRNRLRAQTIPRWIEDLDREVSSSAGRSRRLLEEADEALEEWAQRIFRDCRKGEELEVAGLISVPRAVSRKVLALWLNEIVPGKFPDARSMDHLLTHLSTREVQKVNLSESEWLENDGTNLRILHAHNPPEEWARVSLPQGYRMFFPGGGSLLLQDYESGKDRIIAGEIDQNREAYLALEALCCDVFFVRRREPGDRFHPLGSPGKRKLKEIFIDAKVPLQVRDRLPIVTDAEGQILWVPGFAPAEKARVRPDSGRVIRLTYKP